MGDASSAAPDTKPTTSARLAEKSAERHTRAVTMENIIKSRPTRGASKDPFVSDQKFTGNTAPTRPAKIPGSEPSPDAVLSVGKAAYISEAILELKVSCAISPATPVPKIRKISDSRMG